MVTDVLLIAMLVTLQIFLFNRIDIAGKYTPVIYIIFVLFYFMFIVPNKKEQKKHQDMLKSLKQGDKIVTSGGIVGVIDKISENDDIIRIKSGENTFINVKRSYVTNKIEKPAEEPEKK